MRTNPRGLFTTTAALSATALLASLAGAQPTSIPLGTLSAPGTSQALSLTPGLVQWYSFTLSAPTSASTFLDIVTTGPVDLDTEIGLYNSTGALVTTDDDDGPGAFSALAYGATCPTRTNTSGALVAGPAFNGRDGLVLPAGTYYLAVAGFNATFGLTAYNVTTVSTLSGSVTVTLNLNTAAPVSPAITSAAAAPAALPAGDMTRLTATLTSTCGATTSATTMSVDLSAIGGGVTTTLFNDGTNGDVTAGDSIFSRNITVPAVAPGLYNLPVSSVNTAGTGSSNIALTVAAAPATLTASGGIYTESEPNDSKSTANRVVGIVDSEVITGNTTGTSTTVAGTTSADYYRVTTGALTPGIYLHRLTLTTSGTAGHSGSLRGLTQSAGTPNLGTDAEFQLSVSTSTPARFNQWYGFGAAEAVNYRVVGTAATTGNYNATLTTTAVTPVVVPTTIPTGSITLARAAGNGADMDVWVYDSSFNAIADFGNDGQNVLTRTFAPGTYYAAISNFNSGNNLGSPADDSFRTSNVLDFANSFANSSTATISNMSMTIAGTSGGTQTITLAKSSLFDVAFVQFTVANISTAPSGVGAATPAAGLLPNDAVTLTVTTSPGASPASTGITVVGDLSSIGGSSTQTFFDNGTNGDVTAGDNIYTFATTIGGSVTGGAKTVNFTVADAEARSSNGTINLTTVNPPATLTPSGGIYTEVEDNETKPRANRILALAAGESIVGNTTGASTSTAGAASADTYRITTAAAPLAIYRNRLVISSTTAGHTGAILGLTQSAGVPGTGETTLQTSASTTTPARFNQWYGFGKQESIYYRVTGSGTTTADYSVAFDTSAVSPVILGSFLPGSIRITTMGQGHTVDTDLWVYDSNLSAIAGYGNDDETTPSSSAQSNLVRTYAPGTYYIALSNFNLANNLGSPSDEDFRTAAVLDFADAVANSSTATISSMAFAITDSSNTPAAFPAAKSGAFDIYWAQFTVAAPIVCGTSDFDGDGDAGTDSDIEAFFACLAGTCCPTCFSGGADFDGDGDAGTDADIEAFFRVLAGQPC